jgi:hypothetical protein
VSGRREKRMGRHYCKMCCCSHSLPPISRPGLAFDAEKVPIPFSRAACLLADLERGDEPPVAVELPCATSDFAEEHTIFRVVLQREMQDLDRPGFWSRAFLAVDGLGRPVVVKLYRAQQHHSQRQVHDRFHRELTALGTVGEAHSKGVVRCLGFGFTADLWPYLVLEHGGAPLGVVRRRAKIAPLPLAHQLLETLEYVHMLGLSHNDLTEDNIVLVPVHIHTTQTQTYTQEYSEKENIKVCKGTLTLYFD